MSRKILRFIPLAALLVLGVAACDQIDGGERLTGPASSGAPSADLGYQPGWSSPDQPSLLPLLEREKERIKNEQERTKPLVDSLKVVWEDFLKEGHSQYDSPFLMCQPLSYTADTKIIGPEGGAMGIGQHKRTIPAGALSQYTVITGEQLVSTKVGVKLSPHGLEFLEDAVLEINYKHCYRPEDYFFSLVYIDEHDNLLEWPVSWDVKAEGEVVGRIDHFSKYVLALP